MHNSYLLRSIPVRAVKRKDDWRWSFAVVTWRNANEVRSIDSRAFDCDIRCLASCLVWVEGV
jgi:hypothetical protein